MIIKEDEKMKTFNKEAKVICFCDTGILSINSLRKKLKS